MSRFSRLSVLCLALTMPGCDDTLERPTAFPTPGPNTVTIVSSTLSIAGGPDVLHPGIAVQDVNATAAGRLDMSVDWTLATSDLDIIVTSGECSSGQRAYNGSCQVFATDRIDNQKPARVTFRSNSPGSYRIWIYNFTKDPETITATVLLTP